MSTSLHPADVHAQLQPYLRCVVDQLLQRVYGPDGLPWGTKFAELEELAVGLGRAISRDLIESALARQALDVPTHAESCPGCQASSRPNGQTQPRRVTTTAGEVTWDQPQRYCPSCRAAFSPSGPRPGD
jgi:hypothetical protein